MWLLKVPVLHPLFSYRQVIGRRIEPRTLSSSLSWSRRTLSSSASSQSSPKPPPREGILHYQWIRRTEGDVLGNNDELVPESTVVFVFLHGLFGHGTNLKRFAQQLCQRYLCAGLLIDLPGHGRSHGAAVTAKRPVTVADCAAAVGATLQHCLTADETPRIFGHSLGGRVAVQYALQSSSSQNSNHRNHYKRPDHIWLLDTVPDVPDPTARLVLEILQSLLSRGSGPALRSDVRLWLSETESLSEELIEWLTMQWIETEGRFLFDVAVVRELLDDITNAEEAGRGSLWDQMDALRRPASNEEEEGNAVVPLHLVQAGSNPAWDAAHPRRLRDFRALAATTPFVTHHILPTAGHWVHVDDLPGLLRIIASVHGVRKRRKPYRYD